VVSPALSTSFRVGHRFRCFLTVPVAAMRGSEPVALALEAKWWPKVPRRLTAKELADYRRGRDLFIAEVARILAETIMVLEADSGAMQLMDPGVWPPCRH
jgi:hypothetical protein